MSYDDDVKHNKLHLLWSAERCFVLRILKHNLMNTNFHELL